MAVKAGAWLGALRDAPGVELVGEHIGVAAGFAVVDGECVAGVKPLEPGLLLELLGGHGAGAAVAGGVGRAQVAVVLVGPVDAPGLGVTGGFIDLDEAYEGGARLLFASENVDEQGGHAEGDHRGQDQQYGQG